MANMILESHKLVTSISFQKCQFCMLAMYNGQYNAENDKVQLWKNRGLGPLGPSILDPIYVIYVFGSMLSVNDKNCQKVTNVKRFGARNQFRAARFVTVSSIGSNLNAMELVVRN